MIDDRIMTRSRQSSEIASTWFRPGRPAGDVIMVKNGKSSARKNSWWLSHAWLLCEGKR